MKFVEKVAKTVDDAITDALIELGATTDEVEIEIIDKGSKGFLGIGVKNAKVKVSLKEKIEDDILDQIKLPSESVEELKQTLTENVNVSEEKNQSKFEQKTKDFLSTILTKMGIEQFEIETSMKEGRLYVDISGEKMGLVIGKRGETLDAIQYLTNVIVNKRKDEYTKVMIDTENYRARREETLEKLAEKLAKKASKIRKPVLLEPMNPYDRRIIHSALQENKYVKTHSEGKEPYRRIVITPNNINRSYKRD